MHQSKLRLSLALAAALGAMSISGCTTTHEVSPPTIIPATFSAIGQTPLQQQWWTSLDDPGLDALIEQAFERNFDLRTAWNRLAQAQAVARQQGAALLPTVDGEAGASQLRQETDSNRSRSQTLMLGLAVNYELDLWGRLNSAAEAADYDVQASEQDLQTAAISLAASIANTWYELAEQEAQIRIINEQTQTNKQLLELIDARFRRGVSPASDVLRQQQLVESAQGELVLAQRQAEVLRHQLAVLIGQAPTQVIDQDNPMLAELPSLPETGVPAELIQRRPDVLSAYLSVNAADKRLASAIANQYPRISLSADLQTSGSKARDLFSNWLLNLAANASQPLFDGGERKAEVDRTRAVRDEALNSYSQTILTALQDVEDALTSEQYQQRYLDSLNKQILTATSVVERTRARYLNGQTEYINVLEAITSLQSLQRSVLTAQLNLLSYRIELYRALAGPLSLGEPEPLASVEQPSNTTKH